MATQHRDLGIVSPQMNILSGCSGVTGLCTHHEWGQDFGFSRNPIDISSQALPAGQTPDEASHMSHSSLASEQDSPPLEFDTNPIAPTPKARKVVRHRRIVSMPTVPLQEVTGDIELNKISRRAPKKRGRKGPLPLQTKEDASSMRKRMACAACFVNNVKVSNTILCHKFVWRYFLVLSRRRLR